MAISTEDQDDGHMADFIPVTAPTVTECEDPTTQGDILLLSWILLLYRYSNGNDVQFTWGRGGFTSNVSTSQVIADRSVPLSDALRSIQSLREKGKWGSYGLSEPQSDLLFFRDQCAPDGGLESAQDSYWNVQVEAKASDSLLFLRPSWRQPLGASYIANHYTRSMIEILDTVLADVSEPVSKVLELGELDRSEIWRWNQGLPPSVDKCMHDLISEQAHKQPEAEAICSWDGSLSYAEVNGYSTLLARYLLASNIKTGQIVPICFEKSRWTIVAVLGVMKAGGAFVLMDPSQPLGRRRTIVEQVNASLIILSKSQSPYGSEIAPDAQEVVVDGEFLEGLEAQEPPQLDFPNVPLDSILYLIFTSGSTGKPKGVVINHVTYTTSAIARSAAVGYVANSRVLDFASYAFDVSVDSMLCTLLRGGCLCIPSDEDRLNDLSGAMRRMEVTMANMTPSVARVLDSDIIPSLHSLGLGGESCSVGDVSTWGQHTRIVIGYGPSECTVGCTINSSAAGKPYVSIGPGNGAVIWLADPDDHNRLMPIGAVGELLVEGPIVGQGYMNDPIKTAEAFIEDPPWLLAGGGGVPGRRGRLYKTGDLVQYDPDGERGFVFVGRKDTQVKLRGQRVELGEIEHNLRVHLPAGVSVAAEVIAPQGQKKESMLVAFISEPPHNRSKRTNGPNGDVVQQSEFSDDLYPAIESLSDKIAQVLPIYMVPSAYIAVDRMPLLVSGKTDRKLLRSLGSKLDLQASQSSGEHASAEEPTTTSERILQRLWSKLLAVRPETIGKSHDFFVLGGDSVLAMKLVSAAREQGYTLSVADIFSFCRLAKMAQAMHQAVANEQVEVPSFSLIGKDWEPKDACEEAANTCKVPKENIEDIYPCTPLQEILMAFSVRSAENYVAQRIAEVPNLEIAERLRDAWNIAIQDSPILRTRIAEFQERGFMQVVVKENATWQFGDNLNAFLDEDRAQKMAMNVPLSRYAIVNDERAGTVYFVWTVHHCIYDGWSTDLIIDRVNRAYHNMPTSRSASVRHFIQFLTDPARETSKEYWRVQLQGATSPQYPTLPSRTYLPQPDAIAERYVRLERDAKSSITVATIIRAAWALVASQYTAVDDVVFGETFTGRNLPIPGVEEIEGPMITTVPVRIQIDRAAPVDEYLQRIQEQGLSRIPHEHLGMQNIRRVSSDAQLACEVKMGLVIQPGQVEASEAPVDEMPTFQSVDAAREALHFNSYPLMLACSLQPDGFKVIASFDSNLICVDQMQRVLAQLECASQQLSTKKACQIGDVSCLSEEENTQIWKWRKIEPSPATQNVQSLTAMAKGLTIGEQYPEIGGCWVVNSTDPNRLMPIGTIGELAVENVISPKAAQNPDWMLKGSGVIPGYQGMVCMTGILVKHNTDGSLTFMGNKEARVDVQGQLIDLETVKSHVRRLLPPSTGAILLVVPPNGSQPTTLAAVISEQYGGQGDELVQFGSLEHRDQGGFTVATAISNRLADSLIGLNKSLADVLPPYMVPSVYIPIEWIPSMEAGVDSTKRNDMTRDITPSLLLECRTALARMKTGRAFKINSNTKEDVLRKLWSKLLGVGESMIDADDGFFRLGGDSIMAMKLVSALKLAGYTLSVADIFRNMRLRDMASVVQEVSISGTDELSQYTPFSTLNVDNIDTLVETAIRGKLGDPAWKIQDILVTTHPQSRDVKATVSTPKSSVQYNIFYFNKSIDTTRLLQCCQQLVDCHAILRTVFVEDRNGYLQVVLEHIEAPIHVVQNDGDLDDICKKTAATDLEEEMNLGSPFLKFILVNGRTENALMIRISHAQYDGISFPELVRHLELLYNRQPLPETTSFSKFVHRVTELKTESIQYWRKTLQGSSLTIINPEPPIDEAQSRPIFIKRAIDATRKPKEITMASLLTASWATVLSKYLSLRDITFGGVVSGRKDIPGAENTIGPCYQFMPIRVKFGPEWTVRDLLDNVRDQYLDGGRYETLGFQNISDNCTSWSPSIDFFDSIVHHQDVEYFDTMLFAGTECRVDYTNPHPEPARPLRVVSYPDAGQMWCGIATCEKDKAFLEGRLNELCSVIERLIDGVDMRLCDV
ncbi:hypothetical protein BDV25DRAFT_142208 [Aspergillus avenaceus]|uniref:Carrier domain-containing protein n=1 Tax=Aspergillus avenaceus TaxID=36643 RepID=A0A5N6TNR1_ASPAV|nr:hypothetical protein BDV25DRAFT_142208 [Aspergillus avenaceus]